MWIPAFNKTLPKTGGFLSKKKQTFAENQVNLQSLEILGQPRTQWKKIFRKFYLSSWTSAFGIPLVQDQNVLILDWQTSGSFLPCKLLNFLEKIIANMDGKLNATSMLDKTVLDQRFTKKN